MTIKVRWTFYVRLCSMHWMFIYSFEIVLLLLEYNNGHVLITLLITIIRLEIFPLMFMMTVKLSLWERSPKDETCQVISSLSFSSSKDFFLFNDPYTFNFYFWRIRLVIEPSLLDLGLHHKSCHFFLLIRSSTTSFYWMKSYVLWFFLFWKWKIFGLSSPPCSRNFFENSMSSSLNFALTVLKTTLSRGVQRHIVFVFRYVVSLLGRVTFYLLVLTLSIFS